jgi:hypothetical protein
MSMENGMNIDAYSSRVRRPEFEEYELEFDENESTTGLPAMEHPRESSNTATEILSTPILSPRSKSSSISPISHSRPLVTIIDDDEPPGLIYDEDSDNDDVAHEIIDLTADETELAELASTEMSADAMGADVEIEGSTGISQSGDFQYLGMNTTNNANEDGIHTFEASNVAQIQNISPENSSDEEEESRSPKRKSTDNGNLSKNYNYKDEDSDDDDPTFYRINSFTWNNEQTILLSFILFGHESLIYKIKGAILNFIMYFF